MNGGICIHLRAFIDTEHYDPKIKIVRVKSKEFALVVKVHFVLGNRYGVVLSSDHLL